MKSKYLSTSIFIIAICINPQTGYAMRASNSNTESTAWAFLRTALGAAAGIFAHLAHNALPQTAVPQTPADPHLDRDNIEITNVYGTHETQIIGEGEAWVFSWARRFAPYLLGDLTMDDGSPIALRAGDYLVTLQLNNWEGPVLEALHYLPADLLKKLAEEGQLKLRYRGRAVTITCVKAILGAMPEILEDIEHRYFAVLNGAPFEPEGPVGGTGRKRYRSPRDVHIDEANQVAVKVMRHELEGALSDQAEPRVTQYRLNGREGFQQAQDADVLREVLELEGAPQIGAVTVRPNALVIDAVGAAELTIAFWDDYLLIYLKRRVPEGLGLTEAEYFSQAPRVGVTFVNLKELGVCAETIKDNLKRARYVDGVLVLYKD